MFIIEAPNLEAKNAAFSVFICFCPSILYECSQSLHPQDLKLQREILLMH